MERPPQSEENFKLTKRDSNSRWIPAMSRESNQSELTQTLNNHFNYSPGGGNMDADEAIRSMRRRSGFVTLVIDTRTHPSVKKQPINNNLS